MKKQINPTIKAHLIRGAFYLLLFVAVCAIPFALAQRNATKRSVASSKVTTTVKLAGPQSGTPASLVGTQNRLGAAKPQLPYDLRPLPVAGSGKQVSEEPKTTSGSTAFRTLTILPYPRPPQIVLYDQYDNARFGFPMDIVSQDFEPAFNTYDCFAADDFVVPAGQTWNITEVDVLGEFDVGSAESFNVYFYQDSGSLPGTLVESRPGNSYTGFSDFVITLTSPVTLTPGTYWVAVQSRQDYKPNGQWYWHNRDVQSNQGAAWQNPGDGFMSGCTTWIRKTDCAALQEVGPDEVFRLVGTMGGGGTPTPTPTCAPPPPNMVSWWPGDGNSDDIIDGNNGILHNGATFATGMVDQAFLLDGIDDFVDVGNAPNLHVSQGEFTVDTWVNFNALRHPPDANNGGLPGDMSILDKMSPGGVNRDGWRLVKQDNDLFWFCFGGGADNGCNPSSPTTVVSTTTASTGTWFHIAAVKSAAEIAIYVNGVNEASKPTPTFTDTHSANLLIGANALEGAYLNGLIDEVEIFNRALSASEIQAIVNAGSAGKCKPTPTPTPTPTATATATATATTTPSATPRVTPRPRPTPHPRP